MEAVLAQSCKLAQLSYEVAPLSDDLNSQNVDQMMTLLFDEEGNVEFEINLSIMPTLMKCLSCSMIR